MIPFDFSIRSLVVLPWTGFWRDIAARRRLRHETRWCYERWRDALDRGDLELAHLWHSRFLERAKRLIGGN